MVLKHTKYLADFQSRKRGIVIDPSFLKLRYEALSRLKIQLLFNDLNNLCRVLHHNPDEIVSGRKLGHINLQVAGPFNYGVYREGPSGKVIQLYHLIVLNILHGQIYFVTNRVGISKQLI